MGIRRGAAVAAVALALGGCSASNASSEAPTTLSPTTAATDSIAGTVAVEADWLANVQSEQTQVGGTCTVEGGYDDQADGAQVVITDADGKTVGLGELKALGLKILDGSTDMQDTWCGFNFVVYDVPTGQGYYGVAIGSRDPVQFTEDEVFTDGVDLVLGDVPGQ